MLNLRVIQMQIPSKPHQVIFVCHFLLYWTLCDLWKHLGETTMHCSESGLLIGLTYFGIAM